MAGKMPTPRQARCLPHGRQDAYPTASSLRLTKVDSMAGKMPTPLFNMAGKMPTPLFNLEKAQAPTPKDHKRCELSFLSLPKR